MATQLKIPIDNGMCTSNRPFPLEYSTWRVINKMDFCECSFSTGPYYRAQSMLSCQNNTAAMDGFFDYLKAYYQTSPKLEMEEALCYSPHFLIYMI